MGVVDERRQGALTARKSDRKGSPLGVRTVVVLNDFGHVNGGAAQVAISSAKTLAARGLRVIYFSAVGPVDSGLRDAEVECITTGQADILRSESRVAAATQGIWNGHAAAMLRDTLSGLDRSDTVVHIHGWSKALSASVFRAALESGFECVHTLHDYFSACPNGGFYDYQTDRICTKRALGVQCITTHCDSRSYPHKLWRVARQLVARRTAFSTDGIRNVISLSNLARAALSQYFDKAVTWYDVRNPVICRAAERTRAEDNGDLVFLGRLSPEKGADIFLEAARRQALSAVVVGDGPLLESLAASYPEARFLGWQDSEGVDRVFRSARALVFPSRWYETFGLTVLEALGYGLPIVVSDACAAADFVTSDNGWLFPDGDIDALGALLCRLQDNSVVRAMSQAAYDGFWSDPPDEASHCTQLVQVYEDMLMRAVR